MKPALQRQMTNQTEQPKKKKTISDGLIYETILVRCYTAGPDGAVRKPSHRSSIPKSGKVCSSVSASSPKKLAQRGDIVILRKGQPADPEDFRGLYKLRISPDYEPESAEEA